MNGRAPRRDPLLQRTLTDAGLTTRVSEDRVRRLSARIVAATAPLLREREASQRTIWDYAERWSGTLFRIGALTAIAAVVCVFMLPVRQELRPITRSSSRDALLGAATNLVSSQHLLDLLVSGDRAMTGPGLSPR